jgi:hypothetical protein
MDTYRLHIPPPASLQQDPRLVHVLARHWHPWVDSVAIIITQLFAIYNIIQNNIIQYNTI